MGKLAWPVIPWDILDEYAAHLIEMRKAASTIEVWGPVHNKWIKWCKLYNVNPHDHKTLANEITVKRFVAYRMKVHNIGSSWARGNAYVLRDWWMKHNIICEVDSKAMPLVASMFRGRDVEKPPGMNY